MQLCYTSAGTVFVLSFSLQLSVKTRSVGTNTQEAEKTFESSYMEPCQPGTSVNLEGIVWHETEEGESLLFCAKFHTYKTICCCKIICLHVFSVSISHHYFFPHHIMNDCIQIGFTGYVMSEGRVLSLAPQDCVFKAAVRLKHLKEEETLVAY